MSKYTNEYTQNILVKNKKNINKYFSELKTKMGKNKYKFLKDINSDYIDGVMETDENIFVFRLTASSYKVGISNTAKWWKIMSNEEGVTKTHRTKKNPLSYVPSVFSKTGVETATKTVYYIYPVKRPFNNAVYNEDKYFIGDYEKSIDFIISIVDK